MAFFYGKKIRYTEDEIHSKEDKKKIFERDNFTCVYCGARAYEEPLEIDHVIPISKGGSNNMNNLVTSCRKCNRMKHDNMPTPEEMNKAQKAILNDFTQNVQVQFPIDKPQQLIEVGSYAYWGGILDETRRIVAREDAYEISLVAPLLRAASDMLSEVQERLKAGTNTVSSGISAYNGNHSSYNGNQLNVATA